MIFLEDASRIASVKPLDQLKRNLDRVQATVDTTASQTGIAPPTLIAITKYGDAYLSRLAAEAGLTHLGESRPEVLADKAAALSDCPDIVWHLVGPLQRKKARKAVPVCHTLHAIDKLDTATKVSGIAKEIGRPIKLLIQVNTTAEAQKSGVATDQLPELVEQIQALPSVSIVGLMTMGPTSQDSDQTRRAFSLLRRLRDQHGPSHWELSMGMSGDFQIAIEEGSTMLRLGSILFEGVLPA